jgi:flagellar basal body rod protein FlgG
MRPIVVPAGLAVQIAPDGTVSAGGRAVGRLLLTTFSRPALLQEQGGGLFLAPAAAGARAYAPGSGVEAGYLESSNVNESTVTVQLIQVQGDFQANQTALVSADQTFNQLIQDLGK